MIRVFTAADIAVNQQPLPEDQLITPGVTAGEAEVDAIGHLEVGVWEHSVGSSTAVEIDEVFVIISGRGRITDSAGNVVELAPGVVGVLPAGAETTWEVTEPIRKVWIVAG
ncbi:MAG: cupin domain-containing protein [Candidatus Nanopelagicales bacterium]|nr:cupin domain-containing protein [Candidatus Nanopelagicales bacterium]